MTDTEEKRVFCEDVNDLTRNIMKMMHEYIKATPIDDAEHAVLVSMGMALAIWIMRLCDEEEDRTVMLDTFLQSVISFPGFEKGGEK